MKHGLGHVPDKVEDVLDDLANRPVGRIFKAARTVASADLSGYVQGIRDQGGSLSCVGQALARAIHMRAALQGHAIAYPSAQAIYTVARSVDAPVPMALIDDGCRPRAAAIGVKADGIVDELRWPFNEDRINDRLPLDVYEAGDGIIFEYYRVPGIGKDRCEGIRNALAHGYPLVFGMNVDEAYQNYTGGIYKPTGKADGGHMQAICGFDRDTFRCVNSWSEGWGEGGFSTISAPFMGGPEVSDVFAIQAAPMAIR